MFERIWFMAVLMLLCGFTGATAYSKEYIVEQNNKAFHFKGNKVSSIVIQTGDSIKFKNVDSVFHNIFSLSKVMTFDSGAVGKGKSKTIKFKKRGTVEVECAIHPRMIIEVEVE